MFVLRLLSLLVLFCSAACSAVLADEFASEQQMRAAFQTSVRPFVADFCLKCHNADKRESGIRLDQLDGSVPENRLKAWKHIRSQITDESMPPADEAQPAAEQRQATLSWIDAAVKTAQSRPQEFHGSVRRLTVAQYRNTLRDLLKLQEDLTEILPPDAVSKDGFTNQQQSLQLTPLQVEAYFTIAEQALDRCLVDPQKRPEVQTVKMELGRNVNANPLPEALILGANNRLLENADFVVTQPILAKPFDFVPLKMRTTFRFNEGYEGNSTVRGWRDYDSIYHAVFACLRGTPGYPKGRDAESVPGGLLLRPAIPSAEIFGRESTYGPNANFKLSFRELPPHGNFKVTVRAAKYDDGLLLGNQHPVTDAPATVVARAMSGAEVTSSESEFRSRVTIPEAGVYRIDVNPEQPATTETIDGSELKKGLIGTWNFDGAATSRDGGKPLTGELVEGATFVDSPFGKAIHVDGVGGSVRVPRDDSMNVAEGDFTVAAWIRPDDLRQAGLVCLGKYSWTHGWYFDMPNDRGVLRIETVTPANQQNGTVQSRPGLIKANRWQHVAAIVKRADNETRLYVNGYEVARGTVPPANLDNPAVDLHIGRIQDAQVFHGDIDEVHFFRRALRLEELQSLIEPGRRFAKPPKPERPPELQLQLGDRHFSGTLNGPSFLAVRLPQGPLSVVARCSEHAVVERVTFSRLPDGDVLGIQFLEFEQRRLQLGVSLGVRRDCGSTMSPVGTPVEIADTALQDFTFVGAINDFPIARVEDGNDNYLAGVSDLGVRSEFIDGRDMPRLQIQSVQLEGPYYEQWPPKTHANILPLTDNAADTDPATYVSKVIREFATRAFRRPVLPEEERALLKIWQSSFDATGDFQSSIKDALLVVLTSPQFLFLIEDSATADAEDLSSGELASKLSYFLWNTAPDEPLQQLALDGRLYEQLDQQIDRMVASSKFALFSHEFTRQWLSLDKFDVVKIDQQRFPKLTRDVQKQLREEPLHFVSHLMQHNLPVRHLVESDFVVANEVVAGYYDLKHRTNSGFEFVPLQHRTTQLGGLLSQAGLLAGLSDGREANPVKRGAWVARRIVAEPPDDPPPNVPNLDDDLSHLPLREQLERHRNQPGCAKCHEGIDPWGVPFEEFDAAGRFHVVDAALVTSKLPDGTEVAGVAELRQYLANDRIDQVAFSFLKHVATYAIGRQLTYNEIEFLRKNQLEFRETDYRMLDLIRFVIHSDLFLKK